MEAKAIIHVRHRSWPKSELLLNKTTHPNGIIAAITGADGYSYMRGERLSRTNKSSCFLLELPHILWPGWLRIFCHIISIPLFSCWSLTLFPPSGEDHLYSAAFLNREIVCLKRSTLLIIHLTRMNVPVRLKLVFHKPSLNRVDRFESLMLPLLFFEACSMKRFEHDHF